MITPHEHEHFTWGDVARTWAILGVLFVACIGAIVGALVLVNLLLAP